MIDDRRALVEALFETAIDLSPARRAAWLAEACPDPSLRDEVHGLLAAHEHAGGILEAPLDDLGIGSGTDVPPAVAPTPAAGRGGVPAAIGPYRLLREVGRGGMGEVWLALDERLDRHVALKFLAAGLAVDAEARDRFLTEARAASALDHRNICTIHDVGETGDGRPWLAMAYYEGELLHRLLESAPLPLDECLDVAIQTATGLAAAHAAGIVHCDVKPSNLVRTAAGEVKVLDFGMAKLDRPDRDTVPEARGGTIAYMSPEQARGEPVDARTDLWSLGVVLWEMLAGERPFRGPNRAAVLRAILDDDLPPLRSVRADAPGGLDLVLRTALAKDRTARYGAAGDLARDLARFRGGPEPPGGAPAIVPSSGSSGPPATPGSLPAPLTSFVGRERERAQLASLLEVSRLVTLTGPAGTGKTRLATEAAGALRGAWPDGAYVVQLAPIHDPALVPSAIATALGVAVSGGGPALEAVKARLSGRRVLLVLDNFEQIVAAAPIVAEILSAAPGVSVVATSRVPLRVSGEHELPVPPLALPSASGETGDGPPDLGEVADVAAVRLFVERARAVRPDFALDRGNVADVVALCRRLDGLPLAIELAAARSKLFSPRELVERLGGRLDLLKGGPRDRPARHQTLRQAIAWSYDLLDAEARAFFRRLAVFAGGFGLDAVEAVTGATPGDALEAIEALLDRSLLRTDASDDGPRFGLLETIRAFGRERLAAEGEEEAAHAAHAAWCVALAEREGGRLTGERARDGLRALAADLDNLRVAFDRAVDRGDAEVAHRLGAALWRFWLARGYLGEGLRRLERTVAMPADGVPRELRVRALVGLATIEHNWGDNHASRRHLETARGLLRGAEDDALLASILDNLAWAANELSDLDAVRGPAERALAIHRRLGDRRGEAVALNNLAWEAAYRTDPPRATALWTESVARREAVGDRRGAAFGRSCLAWARRLAGDLDGAEEEVDRALPVLEELGDYLLWGWAEGQRAGIALDRGDPDTAEAALLRSIELGRRGGNRSGLAVALAWLGETRVAQGDLDRADTALDEAESLGRATDSQWTIALARSGRARLAAVRGRRDEALALHREAAAIRRRIGERLGDPAALEAIVLGGLAPLDARGRAVRLAAAAARRTAIGAPAPPVLAFPLAEAAAALRDALGDVAWREAVAAGEAAAADPAALAGLVDGPG